MVPLLKVPWQKLQVPDEVCLGMVCPFLMTHTPIRVSGRTETKIYGKSATVRECQEQQTLPRKSLFGKDVDKRIRLFKGLRTMFSPIEPLFAGGAFEQRG